MYSAARRTSAIVKSTDPSLGQFFAADTATSTRESAELQKRIEALLTSDEEKALWADIQKARVTYQRVNQVVLFVQCSAFARAHRDVPAHALFGIRALVYALIACVTKPVFFLSMQQTAALYNVGHIP